MAKEVIPFKMFRANLCAMIASCDSYEDLRDSVEAFIPRLEEYLMKLDKEGSEDSDKKKAFEKALKEELLRRELERKELEPERLESKEIDEQKEKTKKKRWRFFND